MSAASDPPSDAPAREFLTVPELAALLRVKERKVYDLAASGEAPCIRVTGKLLFPERDVRAWIARSASGGAESGPAPRPAVLLGSHDPLLEWALRQSRCGLATYLDGSLDGLARFRAGEGVAAGLHLRDAGTGAWNLPRVAEEAAACPAALVGWATRRRGLVTRPESGAPRGLGDLAGLRVVPRQPESGAQTAFEGLLAEAGMDPAALELTAPARSEQDAIQAVAEGAADAAFGLEALAAPFGLRFAPVLEERFDLLVDRRAWFEPTRPPEGRDQAARSSPFRARSIRSAVSCTP
jgi:excisionase family DNA binding protein